MLYTQCSFIFFSFLCQVPWLFSFHWQLIGESLGWLWTEYLTSDPNLPEVIMQYIFQNWKAKEMHVNHIYYCDSFYKATTIGMTDTMQGSRGPGVINRRSDAGSCTWPWNYYWTCDPQSEACSARWKILLITSNSPDSLLVSLNTCGYIQAPFFLDGIGINYT